MIKTFDYFGNPEEPSIVLCNPDKTELFSLGLMYDTKLNLRYNAIGDFSFSFPKSIDGGETILNAYQHIKNKKLIHVENYGYYVVDDVQEDMDGSQPIKKITCKSLEYELVSKRVSAYGGTVKLYDILNPEGTLLYDMLQLAPNWTVGSIDTSLLIKYRTFNISDSTVYNVLTSDVANAFECIFVFDTVLRKVSAVAYENATTNTDIFLSFDNLIDNAKVSEKTDEITTCLSVYGGGVLNIRGVNPLGTDKIYDFSYYSNTEWMSAGLVLALQNWNTLLDVQQPIYADNLTLLKTYNQEMIVLRSTLTQLNSDYLSLEGVKKLRVQTGTSLTSINAELNSKQLEINAQQVLINNKQFQIDSITLILQEINDLVSFENTSNFTSPQLLELNNFIYENTYKNENIIQTDSMTTVEIQDAQQDLYDQAQVVLSRISQPRYEIEFEAINYTELSEFDVFTEQTELGMVVSADLDAGIIETVLLEMSLSFDNPEDFSMTFSNRLRLDNGNFTYSDLFGSVVKTGSAVSFDSLKWSNWENNYKDDVTTFITSALDTTTNNLINNSNQEILINQNGLRGRTLNPSTNQYDPTQVWLTSSVLAFTDDSFKTSKLALGSVSTPAGNKFGLVAEILVGNMIAGNTLTISNSGNNFILDANGATLNNAKFNIQTTNTKITIDPTATRNFVIQKNEGGTFVDKFWVDNAGNVNFSGNLTGATGTFSGTLSASVGNIGTLVIDSQGLKTPDGVNYLRGNGDLKWGGLSISGGSATFTGNVYADKLVGAVSYSQLTDIPANKITSGNMSGDRLYGGTWSGSGMALRMTGTGVPTLTGTSGLILEGGSLGISLSGTQIVQSSTYIAGYGVVTSSLSVGGTLYINSSVNVSGSNGVTVSRQVDTPSGIKVLTFRNGICIGFA